MVNNFLYHLIFFSFFNGSLTLYSVNVIYLTKPQLLIILVCPQKVVMNNYVAKSLDKLLEVGLLNQWKYTFFFK